MGVFAKLLCFLPNVLCACAVCKGVITLPPFVRVTASSEASSRRRRKSCRAEDGLIITNTAWCAKRQDGMYASFCTRLTRIYLKSLANAGYRAVPVTDWLLPSRDVRTPFSLHSPMTD